MTEQEKQNIIDNLLNQMKFQGSKEWNIMYEYITNLQSEVEEKESEIIRLKKEIEDLKEDISENYRPISRAEQYDMSECNFH